jgi:hypothetical protein
LVKAGSFRSIRSRHHLRRKCETTALNSARRHIEIELVAPFRSRARPDEFSRLRIRVHGEKVFEVRWDNADGFKVVHYDEGEWERTLRGWPAPVPFD